MDVNIDVDDDDAFNDDIEVLDGAVVGIPRHVYMRKDYFYELDELKFFQRFRLTKPTVLALLVRIEDQLEFPTNRWVANVDKVHDAVCHEENAAVSPMQQLLTTLRLYATGGHLSTIADYMGMHISTASRVVVRVSRAIASLYPQYVTMPRNEVEIRHTQNQFYNIARFPRVIGAIDGTHVKMQSPGGEDAEIFRNRKDYMSINVQGICNANMEFLDVVARWPGSAHDVTIFNNCVQRGRFENGDYPNCVLLGDSGYNVRPYLFTPLLNPQRNCEQLYNEAHIRTRNVIERVFGVWKRRFPILAYGCRLKLYTLLTVIVACTVLHNIARSMGEDEPPLPEEIDEHELQQLIDAGFIPAVPAAPNARVQGGLGQRIRQNFIENFFGQL